jgi:hypothetical protein
MSMLDGNSAAELAHGRAQDRGEQLQEQFSEQAREALEDEFNEKPLIQLGETENEVNELALLAFLIGRARQNSEVYEAALDRINAIYEAARTRYVEKNLDEKIQELILESKFFNEGD